MNKIIVVGGPTAAGKTATAIRIAQHYGCEIISADSRQFYRELEIGTAKPSSEELAAVKHHFVNSLSIHDNYDVNRFEAEVIEFLNSYFLRKQTVVLVGGSGLYLDAIIKGLDPLPERNQAVRIALEEELRESGIARLQQRLKTLDPETAAVLDLRNPVRLIRALEICLVTGKPASTLRTGKPTERPYKFILTALTPERELLYNRINQRVDRMMKNGLLDEVKSLLPYRTIQALNTVGYTELFDYLDGTTTLEEAVALIKQHTRNYAKRQLTWFRNRNDYQWFDPDDWSALIAFLDVMCTGQDEKRPPRI